MLLTPFVLLLADKSIHRARLLRIGALWYTVPAACLLFDLVQLSRVPHSYQTDLLSSSTSLSAGENLQAMITNLVRAYEQSFWGGWKNAFEQFLNSPYWVGAVVVGLLVSSVTLLLTWRKDASARPAVRTYLRLLGVGLLSLGAAFAPFLLSAVHRGANARVFYYSSLGAALAVAAALWLVTRWLPFKRVIRFVALSALITLEMSSAFAQKQTLEDWASIQQRLLGGIVEQIGRLDSDSVLILFDPSHTLRNSFWLYGYGSYTLEDSLRYLYQLPTAHAAICFPDSLARRGIPDECVFTTDGVTITAPSRPVQSYPFSRVIALSWDDWSETVSLVRTFPEGFLTPPGTVSDYHPERLIRRDEVPPPRIYTLLRHWPDNQPIERPMQRSVEFEFSQNVYGIGWDPPQGANAWTTQKQAIFWCRLIPDADYTVRFRASALTEDVLNSLTIRVNGTPIPLTSRWDGYFQIFTGVIPKDAVMRRSDRTEIDFEVDHVLIPKLLGKGDDTRQLGVLLNWLSIEPQPT